ITGTPGRTLELDRRRGLIAGGVMDRAYLRVRLVPAVRDLAMPDVQDVVERLEEDIRVLDAVALARHHNSVLAEQHGVFRERRLLLRRAHVGKSQASDHHAGLRGMIDDPP